MRIGLALTLTTAVTFAAGSPEGTLIVVNGDSWASTWIANEYAAARRIPSRNVIALGNIPSFERIGVEDFRTKILAPALRTAEARGVLPQLDCIVYSADMPWAVDVTADLGGKPALPEFTQPASLTGLTFFHPLTLQKTTSYLDFNKNFFFRQVSTARVAPWSGNETQRFAEAVKVLEQVSGKLDASTDRAHSDADLAQLRAVLKTMLELSATQPPNADLSYNLARVNALLGNGAAAIATIKNAMREGWISMEQVRSAPDFRSLREQADFTALASELGKIRFGNTPTTGFRGSVGWLPNGMPAPSGEGTRYLLSTMLACTSGRGTSASEAVAGLKRSIAADGTRPKGTIYFMKNADVRSTSRASGFAPAAEKMKALGLDASVEEGVLPQNKQDVIGAVIGTVDFDWPKSGSRILPGAIVENFTSFGGVLSEGSEQTPLTEFLRHGAAGSSGTVTEPYAIQAKFPTPFIHWHYAQGATLAEAFYQSVAGPYQLLIVGDALCAPWKKRLAVTLAGAKPGELLRGAVTLKPDATSPDGLAPSAFGIYMDGLQIGGVKAGDSLTFDTSRVSDGHHELSIIASATDALSTTGRLAIPIVANNSSRTLTVTTNATAKVPWDRPVQFSANAPGALNVSFMQFGQSVATIPRPTGTTALDPRTLGQGPVTIFPVATFQDGKKLFGKPVTFTVTPPAPLAAQSLPKGKSLAAGLHVIPGNRPAVVAAKADGDWLANAGVLADENFAVEGWFSVDAEDVYQFQFHGPETLRLIVDGKPQSWPRGKEWWFVPVHLSPGLHKVRIEGKASGKPRLEARFGGPGARKLAAPRFQHL